MIYLLSALKWLRDDGGYRLQHRYDDMVYIVPRSNSILGGEIEASTAEFDMLIKTGKIELQSDNSIKIMGSDDGY